jgi:hypothetical protein
LPPHDYFLYGLHQPWQTEADRDAFLGEPAFNRVSGALAARRGGRILGIFNDKRLTAMILERAGLPMPEIRAIYTRARGATVWPGLHSAEEIVAFLRAPGAMPLFGKPVYGAHSHGAISLVGVEGDEVRLGDGRLIALTALAEEIVTGYPEGYLFQNLVTPHPDMLALTGPALATMRVVTLYDGPEPSVLYAVQKIPGKVRWSMTSPRGSTARPRSTSRRGGSAACNTARTLVASTWRKVRPPDRCCRGPSCPS